MIDLGAVKEIILIFINRLWGRISRYKKPLTWIIIVFITILIFIVLFRSVYYFVIVSLVDQVSQLGVSNVSDKADLINKYRTTSIQLLVAFAQIFGGIVVAIGIYFAWGNLTIAREGHITDRFTRAIDQLGNKEIEIKLGGIYALERISRESKKDYWPIMEILTAYVRNNSIVGTQLKENSLKNVPISMDIQANESTQNNISTAVDMSLDIQAILTVIVRRQYYFHQGETNRLNLVMTHLEGAILKGANLKGAHLEGADLRAAIPVLNKNTCVRRLNFIIFRNHFITESIFTEYESLGMF